MAWDEFIAETKQEEKEKRKEAKRIFTPSEPKQLPLPSPKQLFTPSQEVVQRHGIKVAVHGRPKVGKTHFALTFPEPIYVIDTQFGIAPLLQLNIFKGKEIYVLSVYEDDPTTFELDATATLRKIDLAVASLRNARPNGGTIVVDDGTDVWKFVQAWMRSEILKLDPTQRIRQQWDWMYANAKYQNLIMKLMALPMNFVLVAQDHQVYSGPGEPTNIYEPSWMKQTPYWVDIILKLSQHISKGAVSYIATIEGYRGEDRLKNPVVGKSFEDPTYDRLMGILRGA